MRTVQLRVHKYNLTNKQELLLSTKEFPNFEIGDVVEIYHPEEEYSRLLLQITTLPDDFQQKDTVSVEQAIATAFQLKTYRNVIVNKVDKKAVRLDLVEVLFKDQYFSRSDMHRMRSSMIGTCVYLNKKLEFSEMRAQVNELWSKGEKVTCGVISDDTRIVFRSSTAVVQIFIQMSSEMWDFDINGDLYFEKAVDGFLTDLYAKWKEHNCCHDVTIVMFSRTFYEAHSRDEFPPYMQECLQQDYKGRFYEDFYRVVVQNERYDEWTGTIKQLRRLFNQYRTRVLSYHKRSGYKVPKAYNSTAAQGNFLETLNMTLNLFEKYYMDRNLDRTGKVAVVITPGAGVFEVDRELTNITKQRTIDCGVGSDLVCMGEQPLHAAPLFKFHSKKSWEMMEVGDDYNIPHWMNHSFYTSKNQIQFYSNKTFVPRIKMPPEIMEKKKPIEPVIERNISYVSDDDNFPLVNYEEYDAQVFKLPSRNNPLLGGGRNAGNRQKKPVNQPQTFQEAKQFHMPRKRNISDDISCMPVEKPTNIACSPNVSIPTVSSGDDLSSSLGCHSNMRKSLFSELGDSETDPYIPRPVVGSAGSPIGHRKFLNNYKRHRALINPFAPSRMQFKTTSNRRRWVHIFPIDPHGAAVQTHHVHMYMDNPNRTNGDDCEPTPEVIKAAELAVQKIKEQSSHQVRDRSTLDVSGTEDTVSLRLSSPNYKGYMSESSRNSSFLQKQKSFLWGATGEQEWSPELTTGQDWWPLDETESQDSTESRLIKPILTADFENTQTFCAGIRVDWKSLNMPASLPITTDYLPDKTSLQNDYVVSDYSLLPDDVNSDYYMNPPLQEDDKLYRKHPLTTKEVFNELISQRLAQGFQLIIIHRSPPMFTLTSGQGSGGQRSILDPTSQRSLLGSSPQLVSHLSLKRARPRDNVKEVYLSIGRIFHKLTLSGRTITVTRYRPRHPNPQMCYSYKYRFQAPDSFDYNVSWSEFRNEKLENYNWNYLDQYICTRGEGDYGLMESLKFWRSRYFVLPCNNSATKKIIEGHSRCDIYEEKTSQELKTLIIGMARYLEILNKMKRTAITRTTSCKHTEFLAKNPGGILQPDTRPEEEVLTVTSATTKIVSWMLDPECGIPMLPKQRGLPAQCFISAEVVDWCYIHVKGVKGVGTAMMMLQRVLDDGLIIHASGNRSHKMIHGFYLYTFVTKEQSVLYNPLFQNDWSEVAMLHVCEDENETSVKFDLSEDSNDTSDNNSEVVAQFDWKVMTGLDKSGQTWAQQSATLLHKYVNVEVDPMSKSDRPEWSTARYHAYYSPKCAFELQVQWMVATGCILAELIINWSRKAGSCGFHLIPVPIDPFALPSAPDSDPLRGPIYVPLHISYIDPTGGSLFPGFDKETKHQKMLQFQEAIIKRFGFMPSSVRIPTKGETTSQPLYSNNSASEEYQQYIHCTGGMFVILEDTQPGSPVTKESTNTTKLHKTSSAKELKGSGSFTKKSSSEQRKEYIARQTSQTFSPAKEEVEVGFLWSWNFMSSRRWRTGNTGDEHFQDTVLKDFRAFCSNQDNRLVDFWNVYTDN